MITWSSTGRTRWGAMTMALAPPAQGRIGDVGCVNTGIQRVARSLSTNSRSGMSAVSSSCSLSEPLLSLSAWWAPNTASACESMYRSSALARLSDCCARCGSLPTAACLVWAQAAAIERALSKRARRDAATCSPSWRSTARRVPLRIKADPGSGNCDAASTRTNSGDERSHSSLGRRSTKVGALAAGGVSPDAVPPPAPAAAATAAAASTVSGTGADTKLHEERAAWNVTSSLHSCA